MKLSVFGVFARLAVSALVACFLISCGDDDDDFSPVARNRGYDYAFVSTGEFAEYPCNEMREGRDAAVGRDKDIYTCVFDRADSLYLWVGDEDTLTAIGREYHRPESSSSSDEDDENSSSSRNSSSSYSSSSWIASSSSTPRNDVSSSSYYRSSSSHKKVDATPRLTEKGEQFNSSITYGTMTDPRDGKKYRTVNINGQTWMAENLNYTGNEYGQAFCYNDEEEFCELYGRLYTRDAALNSPDCPSGTYCRLGYGPLQGICPEDWHIPTVSEATLLMNYIGTDIIDWASAKSWKPEFFTDSIKDTYGLSFVPGGFHEDKGFRALDSVSFMWVYLPNDAQRYFVINANTDEIFIHTYSAYVSVPVRCVKGEMKPFSSSSYSSSSSARSSSSSAKSSSSSVSSSSVSSSSSENPSSSFSISSKEDLFNPDLTYGTMTDPRDGKKYKTIVFNGQTWMAENLNFADSSIYPLLKGNSLCYHEKESECELFGRLYNREAAMNNSKCAFGSYCDLDNGPVQGICPDGWHVMSTSEASDMVGYVGSSNANKIMSANGWGTGVHGTNTYGLSFIAPGGRNGGKYECKGGYGYYWTYIASTGQYYLFIKGVDGSMTTTYSTYQELYLPVRCIADAPASSSSSSSSLSSSSAKSSSSSAPPSSSSVEPSSSFSKSDLFNPDITYGEMTDSRDGKTYKTIVFNGQTWMAENLNYADSSKNPLLEGNSHCYDDDPNECEIFGRLYAHPAAMNDARCDYTFSCNIGSGHIQGICPDDWHIPTKKEAEELVSRIVQNEGKAAKSSYGWEPSYRGTNTNGLSFTGAGILSGENFSGKGAYTSLWAYNASMTGEPYYLMIQGSGLVTVTNLGGTKPFYSVRCIKD